MFYLFEPIVRNLLFHLIYYKYVKFVTNLVYLFYKVLSSKKTAVPTANAVNTTVFILF